MAREAMKDPRRWLWRALWLVTGLLVLAGLALGVAVVMLKGAYGAALARDVADGREIAGYGRLEVGPVRGDVLGRFRIEELAIRDAEGVWLEAEDIEVAWSPLALAGRVVDIDLAAARSVRILRRPAREDREPGPAGAGGGFDPTRWRLNLDQARIDEFALADGVAGPAATLGLEARLTRRDGAWRGALSAERTDQPGDRVSLDFTVAETLEATFDLAAAADGPIAALLGLSGADLAGRGDLSGDLTAGQGRADIRIAGTRAAELAADWSSGRLAVTGRVDPAMLPRFEAAARRLSGPVRLSAEIPFGEAGLTGLDMDGAVLDVSSGALSLNARPGPERTLDVVAELGPGALALLTGDRLTADAARAQGRLDLSGERRFEGAIRGEGLAAPGGVFLAAFEGPVTLSGPVTAPRARWRLATEGPSLGAAQADALLGQAADLRGEAVWRRPASVLEFARFEIDAAAGRVSGSASVALGARRWRVEARASDFDSAALTDQVAGAGRVSLEAEGGFDGVVRAEAAFDGFAPAGALAGTVSAPLSGSAQIVRTAAGALRFEAVTLNSPELRLDGGAALEGDVWTVQGDAVWSGEAPVSALTLDGALTARFEARHASDGIEARIEARAPSLSAGPETVSGARLRLDAAGPLDALSGQARLTGEGARGPVDLNARFEPNSDGVRVSALEGRLAGFEIEGGGAAGPQTLDLQARLTPETGFGQAALDARIEAGAVRVEARAEDLVFADLSYLDSARLTLAGPLDAAAVSFAADGAYGARFQAEGQGRLSLAGDDRALTASLEGRYGAVTVASREPLRVRFAPDLEVEADLSLGEGRGVLSYAGGSAPRLSARLENAPAALLSLRRAREPVEGVVSGEADLSRSQGGWTGSARLNGSGLRAARTPEAGALAGGVAVTLGPDGLSLRADASGADLSAQGDLFIETGPVTDVAALADPQAGLRGQVRAEGRIGDFAAFHIDPAQRLSGRIDLNADVSGVLSDPVVVGAASLSDGRFLDARAGLELQALEAELDLTRQGARLTRLNAADGQGGTLTGEGRLDIAEPLAAEAELRFTRFRLADRHDMEAVGTGDVRFGLQDGQGRVSGAAVIDRADIRPNGRGRAPAPQIEVREINRPAGLDPAPARSTGPPIALDYQVSAPRRVFVRGGNYDTEWAFDLAIAGTASDPDLTGEARLVRGRADLLGRSFDLERGQVVLDGDPGQARLDVAAVNARPDLTARIEVEGALNAPQVRLTSEPALPEDEVASRILFGQSAGNLTALQAAQLAGALASLSGGSGLDPLGALRQAAGLDLLGVRRNAAGETVVSGGRYLTDDVFLQLEGAGVGAAPTTRIDWTLAPRVTLSSSLDARGRAGLALSWRLEYDADPFDRMELFAGFRDRLGLGGEAEPGEPADDETAPD